MRASLIQIAVDEDEPVNSRRSRVASLVREVSAREGSDLVVLPELWTTGAFAYESFATEAEPLEGPTYEAMAKAASDAGVWLHAGSIPERDPEGPLYNTSLVFSPDGELAAAYRKIHRFGFDKGEAVMMAAGAELATVRLPSTTLGLATCYDLRFPELFRGLVDAGAEMFVVPHGVACQAAGALAAVRAGAGCRGSGVRPCLWHRRYACRCPPGWAQCRRRSVG